MKRIFLNLFFFLTGLIILKAQCDIIPTIEGENVLCPNGSSVLSTQEFLTYQWYSRAWGEDTPKPIENATGQQLDIDETMVLEYISVEVTYDTCTMISDEVLIDQWLFLLPVISHNGDYAYIDAGLTYICPDHVFSFELLLPYNTNISWYKDGELIPGEQSTTLKVTESGYYTVSGAPDICPDYIVPLGLEVGVIVLETKVPELTLDETDGTKIKVLNAEEFSQFDWYLEGELVLTGPESELGVSENGAYKVIVIDENGCQTEATIQIELSSIDLIPNDPVQIFPNPVQDELFIEGAGINHSYRIMNLQGQLISEGYYNGSIDVKELNTGHYFIQIRNSTNETGFIFTKQD